jgi:ribosome biogenesis GTPase
VLTQYRTLGLPVVLCSAATGEGLDGLLDVTAGKLCVLVGHSGVGKSSLLNALDPDLALATGAVSEASGKGRHTTSSSALYELPNGARIIDTPGIREFGLWQQSREELRGYFHEFDAHAPGCRFADCRHTEEPDCAVKLAVEAGAIPAERYQAYRRVLDSL